MRARRNLFGYDGTSSSPEYQPTPIPSSSESSGVYLEPMDEEQAADGQNESFSMYIGEINEAIVLDPERVSAQIHYDFRNVHPLMESTNIQAQQDSPPRVPIEDPPVAFNVEEDDFDGEFFDYNLENAEAYLTPCDDGNAFQMLHEESIEEIY